MLKQLETAFRSNSQRCDVAVGITRILPHKLAGFGLEMIFVKTLERRAAPEFGTAMPLREVVHIFTKNTPFLRLDSS